MSERKIKDVSLKKLFVILAILILLIVALEFANHELIQDGEISKITAEVTDKDMISFRFKVKYLIVADGEIYYCQDEKMYKEINEGEKYSFKLSETPSGNMYILEKEYAV